MAETVKLRFGWIALAGVFAVGTVGTLGLVVAELRDYAAELRSASERLVAVQERQDVLERQLAAERARALHTNDDVGVVAAERVARLEALVRGLEERAGKASASGKPELPRPEASPLELRPAEPRPSRAVTPSPRPRPQSKAPKLASASGRTPRAPVPSKASASATASRVAAASPPATSADTASTGVVSAEPAVKPALVKPAVARKTDTASASPAASEKQQLFAEPARPAEPIADRRLGL